MGDKFKIIRAEYFLVLNSENYILVLSEETGKWGLEPINKNETYKRLYFPTKEEAYKLFDEVYSKLVDNADGFDKKESEYYFEKSTSITELIRETFEKIN